MIPGSSVQRRMTRRMWADITTQKAVEILQDVTYDLIVDHKRLEVINIICVYLTILHSLGVLLTHYEYRTGKSILIF